MKSGAFLQAMVLLPAQIVRAAQARQLPHHEP
jgi:hypothetical protein